MDGLFGLAALGPAVAGRFCLLPFMLAASQSMAVMITRFKSLKVTLFMNIGHPSGRSTAWSAQAC